MTGNSQSNLDQYYTNKSKASFKARFDLLLYYRITHGLSSDITTDDLESFLIKDNLKVLNEYIQAYWQEETSSSIRGKKIDDIYKAMKKWREDHLSTINDLQCYYVTHIFANVFPREDFNRMLEVVKECEYCHLTINQIDALIEKGRLYKKHITRGWSLEIDRKEPNLEYTKDNCVMCCYWCNNAKTDEFRHNEFIEIGKVIEKIWDERLNSK